MITLSSHTGWPLSESLAMTVDELFQWLKACPPSPVPRHAKKPRP